MPSARSTLFLFFAIAVVAIGCAKPLPPGRSAVDAIHVEGAKKVASDDIEDKIATNESTRFLGLFEGVMYDYEVFDRFVLERDLARIERYYRARGYYEAHARAGRVVNVNDKHVRVYIEVEEGKPVLVQSVVVNGLQGLPKKAIDAALAAGGAKLPKGKPFEEDAYVETEADVKRALTDRGYAFAKVKRSARVDLAQHTAEVVFDVEPDLPSVYGPIRLVGLGDLPEGPVRRALNLKEGAPYSTQELDDAKQSLLDLGVFSSVEIEPELPSPAPEGRVVPLTVHLERTKLRQWTLGAGVELDVIKTDVHGQIGWQHRNFLGGMRRFDVQLKPGIVLYPTRIPDFQAPQHFLPEEKFRVELRQPGFIEARTNGIVRGEVNAYPVLLTPNIDPNAPVLGYLETKGAAGVDRTWWKLYGSLFQNVQENTPYAYLGAKDPSLRALLISYVDLFLALSLRDDNVHPHKGIYLSNDFQYAGIGGDARDLRVQPEARGYVPFGKKVTLAVRGTTGFLFPMNYGSTLDAVESQGGVTEADRDAWARDIQTIFFRGFFSGGPSSNRGYPIRGVGPHGPVPFFNPGLQAQELQLQCDPNSPTYDVARCALPLGGETLWEGSVELRFPITGPLTGATFCDSSDVTAKRLQLRFTHPHLSCGAGARYDTPVGPVRLDIGYRVPGAQVLGGGYDPRTEGAPPTIFGLPLAISFGIGEAF